ncbi:PREDICTED: F-box/LRR-repeat protein 16-like isoform X2 [Priapulus caudatus]|uniref:F-box/LRR-repeat protein 16-like isoform X2 n=1 Tax=Priapulus caudatus TaxID=37621 RepID=A0ABM1F4U7_PRICU|nr:PREDICTED: F-box/LRR-repeat protein 16-like isoform X2 [Priapulus caudatus]
MDQFWICLPEHVVCYIFTFLDAAEKKLVSQVCKAWYIASLHPRLQDEMVFILTNRTSSQTVKNIANRCPPNLTFLGLDSSCNTKQLLSAVTYEWGNSIRQLSFKASAISEADLAKVISQCSNLQCLDLSSCDSLFLTSNLLNKPDVHNLIKDKLWNVGDVRLCNNKYLSNDTFDSLMSRVPNIRSLSIRGCHIQSTTATYLTGHAASTCVLTFHHLAEFLSEQVMTVKALDFSETGIEDKSLTLIAELPNLHLEELHLASCRAITDAGMDRVCRNQTQLTCLNLSGCVKISDHSLRMIAENLHNVKCLNVTECPLLSDDCIYWTTVMKNLEELQMGNCVRISGYAWKSALANQAFTSVTALHLGYCLHINDEVVLEIAKLFQLKHLDLSFCSNITNVSMHAISANLVKLESLFLSGCLNIENFVLNTSEGISQPEFACRKQVHRNDMQQGKSSLHYGSNIPPEQNQVCRFERQYVEPFHYTINNLGRLSTLSLNVSATLSVASLAEVILPRIRYLDLSDSLNLTDAILVQFSNSCPLLEDLRVSSCCKITDEGVSYVLAHSALLTRLDVSRCDGLTSACLQTICTWSRSLRYLDVSACRRLHVEEVESLVVKMPHLQIRQQLLRDKGGSQLGIVPIQLVTAKRRSIFGFNY